MLALLAQATEGFEATNPSTAGDTISIGVIMGLGIVFLVIVLIFAFWIFNIWMAIDCATRQESDFPSNNKNMWLILLIVGLFIGFGWIVAIVYYFSVKKKAKQGGGTNTPTSSGTDKTAQ